MKTKFKLLGLMFLLLLSLVSCSDDGGGDSSGTDNTETVSTPISGKLDTSFGTDGVVKYDTGRNDYANSIAMDSEGNVYVVGFTAGDAYATTTDNDIIILKYKSTGELDNTFGSNGVVKYDNNENDDRGQSIVLNSSGDIFVAGSTEEAYVYRTLILKFKPTGSLDTSFGTDGIATYDTDTSSDFASSIVLNNYGEPYITGRTSAGSDYHASIWKYNSNGVLDTDFSTDGMVTYNSSSDSNRGMGIVLDSNENVYTVGYNASGDMIILKYNSSGTIDSTFGTNGVVTFDGAERFDYGRAIAIDSTGSIYITGNDTGEMYLVKYNSNGALDTSFGTNGVASYIGRGYSIAFDSKENIYVAGNRYTDLVVWKYDSNGTLDTSFGTNGYFKYDGGNVDYAYAITIGSDDKAYITGYTKGSTYDIPVLKLK